MKRIFLTGFLSLLFVGVAFAETPRIGITAGLNVSNISFNESGMTVKLNNKAGFQAGVVADFGISKNFSIMPELLFAQRGTKLDNFSIDGETSVSLSTTLNYLQLPINAAYKFDVGNGSKLFVFAGPYFGYGLSTSGKVKAAGVGVDYNFFKFGSYNGTDLENTDAVYLKNFDFGINVGVGYEYEKIFFKLQYNPGLINMLNMGSGDNGSIKNTNFAVSVGYFFNWNNNWITE